MKALPLFSPPVTSHITAIRMQKHGTYAALNCTIFFNDTQDYNPKLFRNLFIPKYTWEPPANRLSIDDLKHRGTLHCQEKNLYMLEKKRLGSAFQTGKKTTRSQVLTGLCQSPQ